MYFPKKKFLHGAQVGVIRLGLSAGVLQPSCPALPSAQTDGTLLGPAGRPGHVRRLSESHQYKRGERPGPFISNSAFARRRS
jgi:hypothetical protein